MAYIENATKHIIAAVNGLALACGLYTGLALEVWTTICHDQTEEALERIAAFKEKRTPVFKGR